MKFRKHCHNAFTLVLRTYVERMRRPTVKTETKEVRAFVSSQGQLQNKFNDLTFFAVTMRHRFPLLSFDGVYNIVRSNKFKILHGKEEVLGRIHRLLSFDTTMIAQKTTPPTILLLLLVYSLPSNDRGIHLQTHRQMVGNYDRCHDIQRYQVS
jgi:hypothetical protein